MFLFFYCYCYNYVARPLDQKWVWILCCPTTCCSCPALFYIIMNPVNPKTCVAVVLHYSTSL